MKQALKERAQHLQQYSLSKFSRANRPEKAKARAKRSAAGNRRVACGHLRRCVAAPLAGPPQHHLKERYCHELPLRKGEQ